MEKLTNHCSRELVKRHVSGSIGVVNPFVTVLSLQSGGGRVWCYLGRGRRVEAPSNAVGDGVGTVSEDEQQTAPEEKEEVPGQQG